MTVIDFSQKSHRHWCQYFIVIFDRTFITSIPRRVAIVFNCSTSTKQSTPYTFLDLQIYHGSEIRLMRAAFKCNNTIVSSQTKLVSQPLKVSLLKGVFAKNERGYRLNAIKKRF